MLNMSHKSVLDLELKTSDADFKEELLMATFIAKVKILDRIEAMNLDMSKSVRFLGQKRNLNYAHQQTIGKLMELAENSNNLNEVLEILDGGKLFIEFDRAIPTFIKDKWRNI